MEALLLKTRDGQTAEAQGTVKRYSVGVRAARAAAIVVAGFVLGGLTIFIPVVHLISTWLLPLLSLAVAWYFFGLQTVIGEVKGACPQCGHALTLPGGAQASDLWVRCDACSTPICYQLAGEE